MSLDCPLLHAQVSLPKTSRWLAPATRAATPTAPREWPSFLGHCTPPSGSLVVTKVRNRSQHTWRWRWREQEERRTWLRCPSFATWPPAGNATPAWIVPASVSAAVETSSTRTVPPCHLVKAPPGCTATSNTGDTGKRKGVYGTVYTAPSHDTFMWPATWVIGVWWSETKLLVHRTTSYDD